jgi:Rrf2 family iron-sulfur cluster assembly transcriptional regulator|tara:strand:+ start:1038 stop:1490 length:453 start_codon:yes stop_codon:yes gene_type:complete
VNLTTKGKYAVTAVLDLAVQEQADIRYSKIAEVAERQSIPAPYLEQIFSFLRKAEILSAARGPKGGFKLSRPRDQIMIGEIINAVEKNMDATQCSGEGICNGGSKCIAHNFWMDFNDNVNEFLMTRSLDDVISNRRGSVQLKDKVLIATG